MAADRSERPRDERGRFLPSEEAEETKETEEAMPTAPSIGPRTSIDRTPAAERLAQHEQSEVDAMGLDKRRPVVGGSYGPSVAKQVGVYGAFLAVVATLVVGFVLLAQQLDRPPDDYAAEAPWAQPDVEQVPPRPLDFPRNGQTDTD